MGMDPLALPPRPPLPVSNRPLVQPIRGDDRLERATEGKQSDDGDDEIVRLVQAVERGIPGRAEGLPAPFTPIPLLALAVDDNMAFADATIDPNTGDCGTLAAAGSCDSSC